VVRATDAVFAAAVAALLCGRFAVGHDEDPGALFYLLAPGAFGLGLVLLLVATRLADPMRAVLYALTGALLGFAFALAPPELDGGILAGFVAVGACLAVLAVGRARALRGSAGGSTPRARAVSRAAAVLGIVLVAGAILVAVLFVLLLLLLPADV
jgi:hypothetical protein